MRGNTGPGISIVIPSLPGHEDMNRRCVESWVSTAAEDIEVALIEEPGTFAENVNKGLKRVGGGLVCVVNNDSIALPGWDKWLRGAVKDDHGIVSFTPRADCGWAFGGTRDMFDRIGLLDEHLINSYDDYDFFIRAALRGYGRVLAKKVYAIHAGGITIDTVWGKNRDQHPERIQQCMANREYMLRKWPELQIDAVPTSYWAYHGVDIMKEWRHANTAQD